MSRLTINRIFDLLKEGKALINPARGTYRFDRQERVISVFPEKTCAEVAARSASYYSWFLNMDRQAGPVRDHLRQQFEEDACGVVREMTEKCGKLLRTVEGGTANLSREVWQALNDLAGSEIPLFVRGSDASFRLEKLENTAPDRALAWLFLAAGMDGITPGQYQKILASWSILDRMLPGIEDAGFSALEPRRRFKAGELMALDGNLAAAARYLELLAGDLRQALQKTETGESDGDPSDSRSLLGRVLLRLGEIYQKGTSSGSRQEEEARAAVCLQESASVGCTEAYGPLAMLELQRGDLQAARKALTRGAEAGLSECLRTLGNAWYHGDRIIGGRRDLQQAVSYYLRGASPEGAASGDTVCQYMLGRILEEVREGGIGDAGSSLDARRAVPPGTSGRTCCGEEEPSEAGSESCTAGLAGCQADPAYWYEAAARQGNAEAAARLNRLRWHETGRAYAAADLSALRDNHAGKGICLVNSSSRRNRIFARSLPEGAYTVIECTDPDAGDADSSRGSMEQAISRIGDQYLEKAASVCREQGKDPVEWLWEAFPEILCAAFDEEERKNMQDGLSLLRAAFLLHEKCGRFARETAGQKKEQLFYLLSHRVKLYVIGRADVMAPAFDSACSRLGDFYIPLYLCDPSKMASAWLLDRFPLFLPCLKDKGWHRRACHPMEVVIYGNHPGIVQLCKDVIATAQIEDAAHFPFSLTVVGENADLLEERFLTECPGIAAPPAGTVVSAPLFVKMQPESRTFQAVLQGGACPRQGAGQDPGPQPAQDPRQELMAEAAAQRIRGANYLVVYTAEERRNLTLSMFLREWYLKTDRVFSRLPVIACYCEDGTYAELLRTLSPGAQEPGFAWYDNYQIDAFGMEDCLFSWQELTRGRIERYALASHFSYYAFTDREDRFRAEHDYYYRYYNRESSILNALSLSYRLFSAGIAYADGYAYAAGDGLDELAGRFEDWLEGRDLERDDRKEDGQPEELAGHSVDGMEGKDLARKEREKQDRLEMLAQYEHGRWNRAMLSMGWMPASMDQMLAYIQRGSTRHQLYIAKLHPFLCSWEQLGEAGESPTGIQKQYNLIMNQLRPDKEPVDIRGIDRENIRRSPQILRVKPGKTVQSDRIGCK